MPQAKPMTPSNSSFRHHMLREIFEQPRAVAETARGADYPGPGILAELQRWPAPALKTVSRIVIAASGSSRHAGIAGKFMIETLAGLPVEVGFSSELQHAPLVAAPDTLVMVITQSGETADTLAALRAAKQQGSRVVAICNVADAPIMREADARVHTKAGPELAVPSTKSFTAQIAALFLFALWLARGREAITEQEEQRQVGELLGIPGKLNALLELSSRCEQLARKYSWCEDFFFAGRGIHYPIAMDGALKLKEVSYLHAEAFPAGEILHGPLALVDERITSIVLATCDRADRDSVLRYEKTVSIIKELKSRGGKVIAVGNEGDNNVAGIADDFIGIPDAPELLAPLLEIAPLQLFAYYTAVLQGREVDRPRNLTKAVVTE
jgi:glucosamine--fructose-6-phosphate aminotransferase (isomerizing)